MAQESLVDDTSLSFRIRTISTFNVLYISAESVGVNPFLIVIVDALTHRSRALIISSNYSIPLYWSGFDPIKIKEMMMFCIFNPNNDHHEKVNNAYCPYCIRSICHGAVSNSET
jgi:hydrogenase maturation factor